MSDEAIMNALAKRGDLEAKIAKAEEVIKRSRAQIIEVNRFIKQWEKYSGRAADEISLSKPLNNKVDLSNAASAPESSSNPKKEVIAEAVLHILEDAGSPMSRTEVFKALQKQGLTINGANPEMVLSTMLWRTRDAFGILRLKSGGYALPEMVDPLDELLGDEGDEVDIA